MSASEIGKNTQAAHVPSTNADGIPSSASSGRNVRNITRFVSTGAVSIIATPLAMPLGLASAIAFGVPAALVTIANRVARSFCQTSQTEQSAHTSVIPSDITTTSIPELKGDFSAEKKSMSWERYLAFQARVSLLSMIPGMGLNLADCYRRTGSVKNFLKNDLVTNFLRSIGADARSAIYQDARRNQLNPAGCTIDGEDYSDEITELETIIETYSPGTTIEHLRYAAGNTDQLETTLLIPPGNSKNSPTVFYFHGNAETRFSIGTDLLHFTQKGYNVALCSYPGDYIMLPGVIENEDKTQRTLPQNKDSKNTTECSETRIIAATKGILAQFKGFGVTQIGVFGNSLGTGVAGHFIQQAIDMNKQNSTFTVDFALLKVPFSDAGGAAQHFVQNNTLGYGSCGQLVGNIAKGAIENYAEMEALESPGCDGLNTVNKIAGWQNAPGMEKTRLIVVTGLQDHIMGGKIQNEKYVENVKRYTEEKNNKLKQLADKQKELQTLTNNPEYENLKKRVLLHRSIKLESAALEKNSAQIATLKQNVEDQKKLLKEELTQYNALLKMTEDSITMSQEDLSSVLNKDGSTLKKDLTDSELLQYDVPFMAYKQLLETKLSLDEQKNRYDTWAAQINQAEADYKEAEKNIQASQARLTNLQSKTSQLPALSTDENKSYNQTSYQIGITEADIQRLSNEIAALDTKIKREPKFVYNAEENLGRKVAVQAEASGFATVEISSPSGGHGITLCNNEKATKYTKNNDPIQVNSLMHQVQSELPHAQNPVFQ